MFYFNILILVNYQVFIKCFKISSKLKWILPCCFLTLLVLVYAFSFMKASITPVSSTSEEISNTENSSEQEEKNYIKWFEFNVSYDVLIKTANLDINSHKNQEEVQFNWIELIAYLACKCGNDFSKFKQTDLDTIIEKLKNGQTMEEITKSMKYYSFYFEGYDAVLHEFIGEYQIEVKNTNTSEQNIINNEVIPQDIEETIFEPIYGIKAFSPIAKNYGYSHYDDFGNSRSYGYQRLHFGNDLMGSIGTPVIAVESGIVEAIGWNQYGGWRIGIRSFDQKRYYYYAHLRKNHPYAENIQEGSIVQAGDVIGYLGMTGYSAKENVNNINVPHLHFGIQLIFDESQKEGPNQIWVDLYDLVEFLKKNRSEVYKSNLETNDYSRKYQIIDPIVPE